MQNMRRAPREFLRQTALCKIFYSDLKLQNCGTAAKFYRPSVVRGQIVRQTKIPPPALSSQGKIKKPEQNVRARLLTKRHKKRKRSIQRYNFWMLFLLKDFCGFEINFFLQNANITYRTKSKV